MKENKESKKKIKFFCAAVGITLFVVLLTVGSCQIVNKGGETKPPIMSAENLPNVITERNLGKLKNSEQKTVIAKLVEKNPDLKQEYINVTISQVKAIETTTYNVKVASTNADVYIGEVTDVKFTVETDNYVKG